MSFDQYAPYGAVVESSLRVVTWNVWGRYGQWVERQAAIETVLAERNPDIVCLVESWSSSQTTQANLVARRLGFEHDLFTGDWLAVTIRGDRGPVQLFAVMLDYPLHASAVRQAQVRQLAHFISSSTSRRHPVVVCGELTGRSATAEPGLVFYDAWEVAGSGSAGITCSNRNPLAATALYPDRRFDYVLSAWPRLGGVGYPTHCELLGVVPDDQV